ncbi:MAG: hypothetical protein KAH20_02720 [Methylococcales bacterium]|nr:hypothetical protein [Methylococcales bacterium]
MLKNNERQLIPYVLSIIAGSVVFAVNSNITGPMIQPDEGSYLAIAAAIAGYPNDLAGSYYAGYSVLIAPAFWLAVEPQDIWNIVRVINAILFSFTYFGLYLLAKYFSPSEALQHRVIAITVVSLYPAWVIIAGYSSSQVAFAPVFLFTMLAYLRAIDRGGLSWFLLGLISGFLYWIHPTAIVCNIAVVLGGFYIVFQKNRFKVFVIFLLTLGGMIFIYRLGIAFLVENHMSTSGLSPSYHYPSVMYTLSPLLSLEGIREVTARIAGQVFYFSIGTVGLFWLGLFALTPNLNQLLNPITNNLFHKNAFAIVIWFSLVGTIMLTALMFTSVVEAQRFDQWIYGRYVEGLVAPILLAGILNIPSKKILWAIPIAIFCAWVFYSEIDGYSPVLHVNIPALWQDYLFHEQGIWWWLIIGSLLILVVAIVSQPIGLLIIAIMFSFSSYLHINEHVTMSKNEKKRWLLALNTRENFKPGTCVGFDYLTAETYTQSSFRFDFGFVLYDYKFQRTSIDRWLKECNGPLFSYTRNLNHQNADLYLVGASPLGGPEAWIKK